MSEKYANIMLLGRTGVGKSSFINYLVGENVSKVGIGKPITQGFDTYEYKNVDGIPLRIFDSKGLEVKDYQTIKEDILTFVKQRCGNNNVYEWIHTIFYCVNVKLGRIEPKEIAFIKNLVGTATQTVHIILTHCEQTEDGRKTSENIERYIKDQLNDTKIRVYCVNSTLTKTRKGSFATFGREAVVNQIFEILWSDISRKTAGEYARELHKDMEDICDKISSVCHEVAKKFNTIKMLKNADGYMEDEFKKLTDCASEMEETEAEVAKKYQARIRSLADFYNEYGRSIDYIALDSGELELELNLDFDLDKFVEQTKMGRLMNELKTIDDSNFRGILQEFGKIIGALFNVKRFTKEICDVVARECYQAIPSVEQLEKSAYDTFMKAYQS